MALRRFGFLVLCAALLSQSALAQSDELRQPLEPGLVGDAMRGRAIVVSRQKGLCLLCHSGPFAEERFQGSLAPSLAGAGTRWNLAQLRLRIADSRALNPDSLMPSYYRRDGLRQVGAAWQDKPILSAQEIEDVVVFLATLRE
ncbi:sulfur oxidation c-type cytochrome SoxX [Ferrovibrio sp.]|uniref:sulfur oxidation c-type cytochrome SoxX n=1 Tax=Ferrovibrio sp. TaxID=1917215 RepID=UPI003D14EF07